MVKKIYRVEHATSKIGIYRSGSPISMVMFDNERHPEPCEDSLLVKNSGINFDDWSKVSPYEFGFVNTDQFLNWIYKNEWLRALSVHGFVLNVYEGNHVYHGRTQAIFRRETSSLVKSINIDTFT